MRKWSIIRQSLIQASKGEESTFNTKKKSRLKGVSLSRFKEKKKEENFKYLKGTHEYINQAHGEVKIRNTHVFV